MQKQIPEVVKSLIFFKIKESENNIECLPDLRQKKFICYALNL